MFFSFLPMMKKPALLLLVLYSCAFGSSQPPVKRIDSLVNLIETRKTLTLTGVSDTFPTVNPGVSTIETVKFHSVKNKLNKVTLSSYYYSKESSKSSMLTQFDIFYFNNDSLIKVISRDFDETPPKNIQFYIGPHELKKFFALKSRSFRKYDGANYYIDLGYALLDEFKQRNKK